jgi:hypothetical protein
MSTSEVVTPLLLPGVKNTKKKKRGFRPVARPRPASKVKKSAKAVPKPPSASASKQQKGPAVKEKAAAKPTAISNPRKRKQPTSISAGSSRISQGKAVKQVTYAEDQKQDDPVAPAAESAAPEKSTAIVPAVPEQVNQDRDILAKLEAETPEGAPRLSSFCSSFKLPKRAKGQPEAAAVEAPVQQKKQDDRNQQEEAPEPSGAPVVQIVDGEIVLQESSLMMPGQRRTVQQVEEEFGEVIHEDSAPTIVGASYNSFVVRKGPQHWGVDETKIFYDALRQLGTDFCSMEAYFEDRTRKQLKRKYKSEMTKNPALVEMALDPRYQVEVGEYDSAADRIRIFAPQ